LGEEWKEGLTAAADEIIVSVLKYDGSEHRRWPARIAKTEDTLLVLDAVFDEEIEHDLLGTISIGTISTEYYWLDRWYNVFRFSDPDRKLKNFYCNVNTPPQFDGRVLSYIDLDIDVLVASDLTYKILDVDDFEENARRYRYPEEIKANAHRALSQVTRLIEAKSFPFDN
jgi:protein associated with RNAse G/E